ncbi:hypothetical protein GCM10009768_02970 [Leucobacter iarius]|uniref:Uncharacterized protein n=1 Tax=Leucobacter iarius TaxID=333963 RepID=A0ABN2L7F2_9MICO
MGWHMHSSDDVRELLRAAEHDAAGPRPIRARRSRILWGVCIVAAILLLGALLPPVVKLVVFPPTDRGECLFFALDNCISLSPGEIERVFSLELGPGLELVDSGSTRNLKSGSEFAVLRVAPADTSDLLARYDQRPLDGRLPDLRQRGIIQLQAHLVHADSGAEAFVGRGDSGQRLVYLVRRWDG